MKTFAMTMCLVALLAMTGAASASLTVFDGFENDWSGSLAPNWANIGYAHGEPSTPNMEQVSSVGHINPNSGSSFLALSVTAAGTPESSTNWWGGVRYTGVSQEARNKEYIPSVSVYFYDAGTALPSPQLCLVPRNGASWMDVQFGQRWNRGDNYWVFEGAGGGWTETEVARSTGWQKLQIDLASNGYLSFYINDSLVLTSASMYENMGTMWLQTQFDDGHFNSSTVYYDDFLFRSEIPEPSTLALLGVGLLAAGIGFIRRRRAQ